MMMLAPGELTVSASSQDALSDFSESSRDEIREMFGPDMYQERFRVDRSKLEQMIQEDDAAESFFQRIMDQTKTFISWPHRLKVGAKSKKDPHVRIGGRPEDVQAARERVLDVLDAKTDRVNMKLDVSYTDHSHIIGKGGLTIKGVMEATACHIHFPDSNRSSTTEKSNQVSVAGTLEGVEKARCSIRRLMPLIFSFELPVTGCLQPLPDNNSPVVQQVCTQFGVEVMFRQRFKLHSTLVLVKGCDWEVTRVKQATLVLIQYMCGESHANTVVVEMSLEISPHHHSVVLGKKSENLRLIMQQTATRILFPDAGDPNIPALKKSNIRISGNIDKVYQARQQLIGSLPLIVLFDLHCYVPSDHESRVARLVSSLGVSIKMRQKPRQSSLSVMVKGIERDATKIYEACHNLLNLECPPVCAEVPDSYHIPNVNMHSELGATFQQLSINVGGGIMSPTYSPQSSVSSPIGLGAQQWVAIPGHSRWPGLQPVSTLMTKSQSTSAQSYHQHMIQHFNNMGNIPRIILPAQNYQPMYPSPDSAIHSSTVSSSVSSMSSPNISPRHSSSNSPTHGMTDSALDLASMLSDMPDRRAPGCERKTLEKVANTLAPPDYEYKRMQAYKATHGKPVANVLRVPTSSWSGSGLSVSSPEYLLRKNNEATQGEQELWANDSQLNSNNGGTSGLSLSNYLDSVPRHTIQKLQEGEIPSDLTSLFLQHGLEKYLEGFLTHEIDLKTFLALSETDLYNLGVDKFGPRRKMVLIISELKEKLYRERSNGNSSQSSSSSQGPTSHNMRCWM